MLQKVHNFWIKDLLEQSLYAVARLELGLTTKPDAVEWDVWNALIQRPDKIPLPLPSGTRISTVFDKFDRTLLILGAPGTGKTTLLLELTKDLLARAEQDLNHPLPIVFNLSSWAVRQSLLADWLVDELWERYQVPRKHAQTWVDKDLILPLLDGLDEVAPECRSACAEAINAFRQQHGLVPIVVCSRQADYEALAVKLRLQGALVLQSLTRSQINHYLAQAGEPLAGVRAALQEDKTLWELLDTPLMLSIVVLAYGKRSAVEMQSTGTLEERKTQLFAAYTDAMFTRRGKAAPYSRQQTVQWLVWLAAAMASQHQSVFYLEWLQPNWLPGRIPQWIVFHGTAFLIVLVFLLLVWLFIGLDVWFAAGLVLGLDMWLDGGGFLGLVGWLVLGLMNIGLGLELNIIVLGLGQYIGLGLGYYIGLGLGLFGVLVPGEMTTGSRPNEGMRRSWHNALLSGLAVGLVGWLVLGLAVGLAVGLVAGLRFGLVLGLGVGLATGGACLQHLILRFLLWRNNYAPWHYVRFLDYAAERVFLRKVGGGYVFIHRILLEYFATLYLL